MRESKIASFKQAEFTATFLDGELSEVKVKPSKKNFSLTSDEVQELYGWLAQAVLGMMAGPRRELDVSVPITLGSPASSAGITMSDSPLAPGYIPLSERGSVLILPTNPAQDAVEREAARQQLMAHPGEDAKSVKHLLPIETALKKEGMKLEKKDVPAQQVQFTVAKKSA